MKPTLGRIVLYTLQEGLRDPVECVAVVIGVRGAGVGEVLEGEIEVAVLCFAYLTRTATENTTGKPVPGTWRWPPRES